MGNYSKKQLEPIIKKYSINVESDATFNAIINLFSGQSTYQIWALKAVYEGIASLSKIRMLKQFADENQTLIATLDKKNLVAYKTKTDFKQLDKEIETALHIMLVKRCIEQFNTQQRNMLKQFVFGGNDYNVEPIRLISSTHFKNAYKLFRKFSLLPSYCQHRLIQTSSAINDDVNFLIQHIKGCFTESYTWNKEDLLAFISYNPSCKDVKVAYENGDVVVLEIPNFEASKTLCGNGRTGWCITRESRYFDNYAGKSGNVQFFFFDFSKPERHELAHVGFTINKQQGFVYAHSTTNQSMVGSGAEVNGKRVSIQDLFHSLNIETKHFIHLNGIKGFEWNLASLVSFINNNCNGQCSIVYNANGRLIVRLNNAQVFEALCGNTLIRSNNLNFSEENGAIFVVFDTNINANDDNCMVVLSFGKDDYDTLSLRNVFNAYNINITKDNYLSKIGIPITAFLKFNNIKPNVLLHKLLDEKDEAGVIALLKQEGSNIDVNFDFKQRIPIFTAISNGMIGAFSAIINSPSFKTDLTDVFGETLLNSLIYEYRQNIKMGDKALISNSEKMISAILDMENYDFNSVGINLDSAINVAAEREATTWILSALVKRPNVNVNIVNDVDRSCLGNAIYNKNLQAIEMLGKRPDLIVREADKQLAKENGINISQYIKPEPFESTTDGETIVNNLDKSVYLQILKNAFVKK